MSNKEIAVIIWLILLVNTALGLFGAAKAKKMILEFDPETAKAKGIDKKPYDRDIKISFHVVMFIFKSKWKNYPRRAWKYFYFQRFLLINQVVLLSVLLFMIFGLRVH